MKELLKNNFKIIIIVVITAIVTSFTSIFAYSLVAENVGYTPHDNNWNVDNVEAAINELNLRAKELSTNFSTEEQVVGRWIDGKPLYQKTITDLRTPSSLYAVVYSMPNAEIKYYRGLMSGSNSNRTLNGGYFGGGHSEFFDIWVDGTNVYVNVDNSHYNKPMILTIQYTKTTD